jgi:hypothetical protein
MADRTLLIPGTQATNLLDQDGDRVYNAVRVNLGLTKKDLGKDPSAWVHIGNEKLGRLDSVAKTTGAHQFPIDVRLPGMLTAVLARPPRFRTATRCGAQVRTHRLASNARRLLLDVPQRPARAPGP